MAVWTPPKKLKIDGGIGYPIRSSHLDILQNGIYDLIAKTLTEAIAGFGLDETKAVLIQGSISKNPSTYNLEITNALVAWAGKIYYIPSQIVNNLVGDYTGYYFLPSIQETDPITWRDGIDRPTMFIDTLTPVAFDDYQNDPPAGSLYYYNIKKVSDIYWIKEMDNYQYASLNPNWIGESGNSVRFRRNQFSQLYIQGRFKLVEGGNQSAPLFTLPVGYRPSRPLHLTLFAHNGNIPELPIRIVIDTSGEVGGVDPYDTISSYYYSFHHVLPL